MLAKLRAPVEQGVVDVGSWAHAEPVEAGSAPQPHSQPVLGARRERSVFIHAGRHPAKIPYKTDFLSLSQNYCLQKGTYASS